MVKNLFGKVFGDRWYISQELFQQLLEQGIFMVTRVKKNMIIKLMSMLNEILLLLKRSLIESVCAKIKLFGKFEHSRHSSVTNDFVHMLTALINYQISDNKPAIKSLLID